MFNFASSLRIYLCVEPTDMRKSFNGLYAIARHELGRNPI
ncbi:MAG: IS66 family insertion sequence element accessory protein TnpB, partial [Opitutales bacterium]